MTTVTLEAYEKAERELVVTEGRIALRLHTRVTLGVWVATLAINYFLATGFPWSAFVVAGSGMGLFFHWVAYRRTDMATREHQAKVEMLALYKA